ncbi:MAG: response regulator [Bacteroidetes bacterium]|nr:response regulator [Bacteroidota bacterium]
MIDPSLRILIADDNPINQKVLEKMLSSLSLNSLCVQNGKEAVEELRRNEYDVVFMDLQMPEMGGIEAAQEIRKMNGSKKSPFIIAVTANTTAGIQQQCYEAGMNEYLEKPVRKEFIQAALHRFLALKTIPKVETMNTSGEIIDQRRIDELMELEDSELLKELIRIYFQESEQSAQEIEKAIACRDAEGVHHAAHKLKGGAGSIGAKKVTALSVQIEQKGISAELQGIEEIFQKLQSAMAEAKKAFTKTYLSE